jgi:hypothetical protein
VRRKGGEYAHLTIGKREREIEREQKIEKEQPHKDEAKT